MSAKAPSWFYDIEVHFKPYKNAELPAQTEIQHKADKVDKNAFIYKEGIIHERQTS